jgi:hypothetical protein
MTVTNTSLIRYDKIEAVKSFIEQAPRVLFTINYIQSFSWWVVFNDLKRPYHSDNKAPLRAHPNYDREKLVGFL